MKYCLHASPPPNLHMLSEIGSDEILVDAWYLARSR